MGVSKRRTQAATLVLRLMGRCAGLKRPYTGPCLEGRAKKDISMLFSPVRFLGALRGTCWRILPRRRKAESASSDLAIMASEPRLSGQGRLG
jgi:hypothetical protein